MSEDRIDFSALDPKQDPARYDRMVARVLAGAQLQAPPPEPMLPVYLIGVQSWGGKALALAALAAALVWLPHSMTSRWTPSTASSNGDTVELVSKWAQSGEVPSDVDLDNTLGLAHVN